MRSDFYLNTAAATRAAKSNNYCRPYYRCITVYSSTDEWYSSGVFAINSILSLTTKKEGIVYRV